MSDYVNEGKRVIAIGDFNKSYSQLVGNNEIKKHNRNNPGKQFYVLKCYDEEETNNYDIMEKRCCSVLDHVITSFDTRIEWEYNWDYMIDLFGSVKNKATYINMRSIPDHAMLKVKISIN